MNVAVPAATNHQGRRCRGRFTRIPTAMAATLEHPMRVQRYRGGSGKAKYRAATAVTTAK
jgi:hypothetical protein